MWRSVAANLNSGHQRQFFQDISPALLDKKSYKCSKQEKLEIWMAAANMESLDKKNKMKIGSYLINEIITKKSKSQLFWSLSHLGARIPLYSSIDRVIDHKEVSKWLIQIISARWRNHKTVVEMVSIIWHKKLEIKLKI